MIAHLRVGGAGATDESRFVPKAASVHTHFKSIKFGIKQHKGVWPVKKSRGKVSESRDTWEDVINDTAH